MTASVDHYLRIHNGLVTDEHVIQDIMITSISKGKKPKLRQRKLEERVGLVEIPKEPARVSDIILRIGNPATYLLEPKGTTLTKQIETLIPAREELIEYHSSLTYFLTRILIGNLPRQPEWVINHSDLDNLTSTLFILHIISTGIGTQIDWIKQLHDEPLGIQYISDFETQIPRADSYSTSELPNFAKHAKMKINAIHYEPLKSVCSYYSRKRTPQPIGRDIIASILKMSSNTARYPTSIIDLTITERFFPVYHSIGLRNRWIITNASIDKLERSTLTSPGLVGRFLLRESQIEEVLQHVEPIHSGGPEILPPGVSTFNTEHEMISFRLDLFNKNENRWNYHPWENPSQWLESPNKWNPKKKYWLLRNSEHQKTSMVNLTKKQAHIYGILLSNRGSPSYRRLLLDLIGDKRSNLKSRIDRLCNTGSLEVLYHPSLEYSGLPEGLLLVFPKIAGKSREFVKSWLIGAMPYSHLFWGIEYGLVAQLRIPENATGISISFLREFLSDENDAIFQEIECSISSIKKVETYTFTMPGRLYDPKSKTWKDPWWYR